MCFGWMRKLYHYLRRKCSRRNRGYSQDISLNHRGFCSGALTNRHGRMSFSYDGDSSVTFSRRPARCPPLPPPGPYSVSGGLSCDPNGAVEVPGGDRGVTSGWDVTVGAVPVYGSGVGLGYGTEDWGPASSAAGASGGAAYHGGDLGISEGAGGGYGYPAPLGESEGSGYHGGGLGYGIGAFPGPELSPAGGKCAPVLQQKCPVVVPPIQSQQCKKSPQWPPVHKK